MHQPPVQIVMDHSPLPLPFFFLLFWSSCYSLLSRKNLSRVCCANLFFASDVHYSFYSFLRTPFSFLVFNCTEPPPSFISSPLAYWILNWHIEVIIVIYYHYVCRKRSLCHYYLLMGSIDAVCMCVCVVDH